MMHIIRSASDSICYHTPTLLRISQALTVKVSAAVHTAGSSESVNTSFNLKCYDFVTRRHDDDWTAHFPLFAGVVIELGYRGNSNLGRGGGTGPPLAIDKMKVSTNLR
jgi:hypothetical protein